MLCWISRGPQEASTSGMDQQPASEGTSPSGRSANEGLDCRLLAEPANGYLSIRISGTRTGRAVSAMIASVIQAAKENGQGRLLIDVREFLGRLNVVEAYYLVRDDFIKAGEAGLQRVAIIDQPLPEMQEWFMERTVRNRGYDLRIFAGREEALDWLLSAAPGPQASE
jgi:hypothetical protein